MRRLLLLGFVLMAGCSGGSDWYPLEVGNEWTYSVRTGLAEFVEPVKVVSTAPAAGTKGFQLSGNLGTSRLAWKGKVLCASELPNLAVAPNSSPFPLLVADDPTATRAWSGSVMLSGKTYPAVASLKQSKAKLSTPGRTWDTVLVTISLKVGDRNIEILTWYAKGHGPVRQEQRTNGVWDVGFDYLSGP